MKSYKHYIKFEKESKFLAAAAFMALLLGIALIVLQLCGMFDEPLWQPDVEFPMVNTNVSWSQTYHPGPWSGGA